MQRSHDSYKHKAKREKPETKEDRRTDGPDPEQGLLPGTDQGSPKSWMLPCLTAAHRQESEPRTQLSVPSPPSLVQKEGLK